MGQQPEGSEETGRNENEPPETWHIPLKYGEQLEGPNIRHTAGQQTPGPGNHGSTSYGQYEGALELLPSSRLKEVRAVTQVRLYAVKLGLRDVPRRLPLCEKVAPEGYKSLDEGEVSQAEEKSRKLPWQRGQQQRSQGYLRGRGSSRTLNI